MRDGEASESESVGWWDRPFADLQGEDRFAAQAMQEYLAVSTAVTVLGLSPLAASTGEGKVLVLMAVVLATLAPGWWCVRTARFDAARVATVGFLAAVVGLVGTLLPGSLCELFLATNTPALFLWLPSRHRRARSVAIGFLLAEFFALTFVVIPRATPIVDEGAIAVVRATFLVIIPLDLLMTVSALLRARDHQEHALARARDDALAGIKAKTRILNSIAHELRSPLAAAIGLLAEGVERGEAGASDLRLVRSQVELALRRTTDLLDFSRADGGTLPPARPRALRPGRSVERMARAIAPSMRLDVAPELLEATFLVDQEALQIGLRHLIDNVVRHASGKGCVRARVEDGALVVEVADEGAGVPEDRRGCIFEPLETLSEGDHDARAGQGIGLALTRALARRAGGDATLADAAEGEGATFTLRLPLREAPAAPEAVTPPLELRVLVVEDEKLNRTIAVRTLEKLGCEVVSAEDGLEALEVVRNGAAFDLVLMDVRMPRMDGLTATELIKLEAAPPAIVALTANALVGDEERCRQAGMDDFLPKPLRTPALLEAIARLRLVESPPAQQEAS